MPWCEECAKYRTPNSVNADGTCPTCGSAIEAVADADADAARLADEKSPWHFKLLVFMVVAYLGWRLVDLVV